MASIHKDTSPSVIDTYEEDLQNLVFIDQQFALRFLLTKTLAFDGGFFR